MQPDPGRTVASAWVLQAPTRFRLTIVAAAPAGPIRLAADLDAVIQLLLDDQKAVLPLGLRFDPAHAGKGPLHALAVVRIGPRLD